MLAFVVPFRSKESSSDWRLHCALLERTIASLCNQTDDRYKVYIVCTDIPDCQIIYPNVQFLQYPFPFLKANEIEDFDSYASKYYSPRIAEFAMDQGRKTMFGAVTAIAQGCTHIMSFDADDLVSNKLAAFVAARNSQNGWFIDKGYIYVEGRSYCYRQRHGMNNLNGSTNIVRKDLVPIVDFNSKKLLDYNFFSAHAWLPSRLYQSTGAVLQPMPYYGLIYSLNANSWTNLRNTFEGSFVKQVARILVSGKLITHTIKNEFGLRPVYR